MLPVRVWTIAVAAPLFLTACGGSTKVATTTAATTTAVATTPASTTSATTTSATTVPGALQGEALSAAAGDIPDNQVFLRYTGPAFSLKVPEGWARQGDAGTTTFRDKNNIVRIVVVKRGGAPTVASMTAELRQTRGAKVRTAPHVVDIAGRRSVAATYTTTSAPNAVTGKRVTLTVDRYEWAENGTWAIADLGTPVGVDNVDAYRLMIETLRLR